MNESLIDKLRRLFDVYMAKLTGAKNCVNTKMFQSDSPFIPPMVPYSYQTYSSYLDDKKREEINNEQLGSDRMDASVESTTRKWNQC